MKRLNFICLAVTLVLVLAGCDGKNGSGGAGTGPGGPDVVPDCLSASTLLQVPSFADTATAVSAFAIASGACKASAGTVRAVALKLEQNGTFIQGEHQ